jgi:hypothetical protein
LNFFTNCDLSDELIDGNEVYYYNSKVYDRRFVDVPYDGKPTLKVDTVTLNDSDTLQASDDDIDEDEEFNWDDDDLDNDDLELEEDLDSEQEVEENPYTIAADSPGVDGIPFPLTTYQYMEGNLTAEHLARAIAASPELQSILTQINDIATDSQQEQHIIF